MGLFKLHRSPPTWWECTGVHLPQHPGTGPRPARAQYPSRTGADLAPAGAFALQVRGILTPTVKALTLPATLLCAGLCMSLFAAFCCAGGPAFSYGRHAFLRAASAHSVRAESPGAAVGKLWADTRCTPAMDPVRSGDEKK